MEDALKFKKNLCILIELFQEIIIYVKSKNYKTDVNANIFELVKFKLNTMNELSLIESFISKSYYYWDMIKENNELFLIENSDVLFEGLPSEYITLFTDILKTKDLIDEEIKNNIWEILHGLVVNSIKHVHVQRNYNIETKTYTVLYAKDIKLKNTAKIWNVDLK